MGIFCSHVIFLKFKKASMKFVASPLIITLLSNLWKSANVCASDIGLHDSMKALMVLLFEESIFDLARNIFSFSLSMLLVTKASLSCLTQYSYFMPSHNPV